MQNKIAAARFRAKALSDIRAFFSARNVLEVETPLLSQGASHDFHIDLFSVPSEPVTGDMRFLQTSPEPHMKRLLARGYPDIFQISKAFRMGESGKKHNPEFSMIEWYRLDFSLLQMMAETVELCQTVVGPLPATYVSYGEAFLKATGLDPFSAGYELLVSHPTIAAHGLKVKDFAEAPDVLNFLMSEVVEPSLNPSILTIIHSFPLILSSQAQPDPQNPQASLRFEVFAGGMELGNGYQELRDIGEYRLRFERENAKRKAAGKPVPPLDERLFGDMQEGFPACSGVAVGLDRLIQLGMGLSRLNEVLEFPWEKS